MTNQVEFLELMESADHKRNARRNFIRMCGGAAAATGGLAMLSACGGNSGSSSTGNTSTSPTPTPTTAIGDADVLNFALQLEYLEAAYYSYAVAGAGLPSSMMSGTGAQGVVLTGSGTGAARQVTFTDSVVAEYAREITADEVAHVTFLRNALGASATAMPTLNISGSASVSFNGATLVGAFTAAARAAGVVGSTEVFDPYANDQNFLIGAYLLEDVGVSAYRGSAKLISNKTYLEAAAGILAVEAYHDALIRAELWARGLTVSSIYSTITKISDARDSLDGPTDTDQDIGNATTANFVPTNSSGLVLGRTAGQVLDVVYLSSAANTVQGGFYPSGVNGRINASQPA